MSELEKEFVPYKQALELRELGFDEPCLAYYDNDGDFLGDISVNEDIGNLYRNSFLVMYNDFKYADVASPLFSQAFRWFREKYNLRGFIGFRPNVKKFDYHIYDMSLSGMEYVKQRTMEEFNKDPKVGTYEEAELACLRKLIEILKSKQ